ncbi:Soluble epoxide hydrolase [Metarhizium anisopliae]|nr:Soluble epoxide hydrolase [Metarhizium anisopliae]
MTVRIVSTLALAAFNTFVTASANGAPQPFDSWSHGRVQLDDVSIHFRYAGSGPPMLLVHGNPQHSYTWRTIGPILANQYTVIAPDNRGTGDSSIPEDNNYSSEAMAGDLKGLLDFLKINQTLVFSHDKGSGPAVALAAQHPSLVPALGVSEYLLPGFGYEESSCPSSTWDLYSNWQLAFFSVPDAAEFFIRGKEKEMLAWYFYHQSYSGNEAIPEPVLQRYASSISKPGFLRSMLGPFSTASVRADNKFFTDVLRDAPLQMPMIAIGAEASFAPESTIREVWGPVASNLTVDITPKSGHWIADENPEWVAERLREYFGGIRGNIQPADLSWLSNRTTLV